MDDAPGSIADMLAVCLCILLLLPSGMWSSSEALFGSRRRRLWLHKQNKQMKKSEAPELQAVIAMYVGRVYCRIMGKTTFFRAKCQRIEGMLSVNDKASVEL